MLTYGVHAGTAEDAADFLPELKGRWAMVEDGDKVRFAMGVFDDRLRLDKAVRELERLGLDTDSLCLVGEPPALRAAGDLLTAGSRPGLHLPLYDFHGSCAQACQAPSCAASCAILEALRRGDSASGHHGANMWLPIGEQLRKGALLLVARVPSAGVQDAAVRVLLKHSRHSVHSEEFFCLR